jgi:branched-chain amino acid transport system substrate-binding protein
VLRWWPYAAAAALAAALAGCGVSVSASTSAPGHNLTIYSSLPLDGPRAPLSRQIVRGEKLALADARGRAGRYRVSYFSLDDSSPASGRWEPELAARNANLAAQDNDAIAYLGDLESGATAISLPLTNAAGLPQVSPGSPYAGFTSSTAALPGEPERFYPSGRATLVRLDPGDGVEAAAQVRALEALGVRRLYLLSDADPVHGALAELVGADARRAGIAVVGDARLASGEGAGSPEEARGAAARVGASAAQAVFYSGAAGPAAVALWQALHARSPTLDLLGSHELGVPAFTGRVGDAGRSTLIGSPYLPLALYPAAARGLAREYGRSFGEAAGPGALYGYEAMSLVLDAIARAGRHGGSRDAVRAQLLATRGRGSAIGTYSVQADGETTLSRYAIDRVRAGVPVLWRVFDTGA